MRDARPRDLDETRVSRLLHEARPGRSIGERLDHFSALLRGAPYAAPALVGSATEPEVFTASLDGFDCVTYVETVLALARASTPADFARELRAIRYDGGRVEWRRRNHYMTGWIRSNARGGRLRALAVKGSVRHERLLDAVPGLPRVRARFTCLPKRFVPRLSKDLRTGDLVFFASTKPSLDVFHCGLLVNAGGAWRMRHAARSLNGAVEQDLAEFLAQYRMSGVLFARPLETRA
jgi:cell wall-associated NlpC family hydrolase